MVFEFILSLLFLIFSIISTVLSYKIGINSVHEFVEGPGIYPFMISICLTIMGFVWIIKSILAIKEEKMSNVIKKMKQIEKKDFIPIFKVALITLFSIIYVFGFIPLMGFVLSTIIYLVPLIKYFGKKSIIFSLIVAIVLSGSIYYMFSYGLKMPLPR